MQAKEELGGSTGSDFLVFSRAVQGWREGQDRETKNEYMYQYSLSGAGLRFIQGEALHGHLNYQWFIMILLVVWLKVQGLIRMVEGFVVLTG